MSEPQQDQIQLNPWHRRLASVSIALAVLGTVVSPIVAAIGLVLGAWCWWSIRKAGADRKVADTSIMGVVFSALVLVAMLTLPPGFAKLSDEAGRGVCEGQQRRLAKGLGMYHADYDDVYPNADNWSDAILGYTDPEPPAFVCPKRVDLRSGYALNERVAGVYVHGARPDTRDLVVAFEADLGWNGVGYTGDFVTRHGPFGAVLLAGGHVRWIKPEEISTVRWDP